MSQSPLEWVHTVEIREIFPSIRLLDDVDQAGVDICESFDERLLTAVQNSAVGHVLDRRMFHIYELLNDEDLFGWQIRNLFPSKHHFQLEDMLQVFLYIASGKTGIELVVDVAFRSFVHTNQVFIVDLWYDEGGEDEHGTPCGNLSAEGLGDDRTMYNPCYIVARAYDFEAPIGMRKLTELEDDAYGPGGPSSGQEKPRWKPLIE